MLERVHKSYLGIEKSRSRAREIVFWPKMSQDIENLISKRAVCQESQNRNQNEPLHSHGYTTVNIHEIWVRVFGETIHFT